MNAELIKALELMVYPRHTCKTPFLRDDGGDPDTCRECGKNFRSANHFRVGESHESDKVYAVATLHKAKLRAATETSLRDLFERLQGRATRYLTDELSAHDFISEVLGIVDGPEQRAAVMHD